MANIKSLEHSFEIEYHEFLSDSTQKFWIAKHFDVIKLAHIEMK